MFAGYLFLRFKDSREIHQINPSQTLMNLQYTGVCSRCLPPVYLNNADNKHEQSKYKSC